jgi:hypothetical protein
MICSGKQKVLDPYDEVLQIAAKIEQDRQRLGSNSQRSKFSDLYTTNVALNRIESMTVFACV